MTSNNNIETLTWKIKDISNYISRLQFERDSPSSVPNGDFTLWLNPNDTRTFEENCATVVLNRTKWGTENCEVEWKISLIDREGQKRYTKVSEILFTKTLNDQAACGGVYCINSDFIKNAANGFLVDDTLTLYCEIKTLTPKESLERTESIMQSAKLQENLESLLYNSKHSDVICVVGKKEFKLHKNILSARSPVFAAMFDSDLSENKQNRVEILDVEVEVFEELVRFIYTGKFPELDQHAWEMFVVSDKYQLDSLKDLCEKSLTVNLTVESVTKVLTLADMHNATKLKVNCIDYVTEHSFAVMSSEEWKQMVKQRIELVIELYQRITVKYENKRKLDSC